ncbi:hypothetical protein GXW82_43480 [Streptacidiphilus sp. 4-A2]|nr:hypothetical protein [Streptacidiphilus sp. 4-A2]
MPEFNEMVATGVIHRHSKLRFTVATRDLENHRVRGPRPATANPSPPTAAQEDTEKRPEPAQGEQTT